MVAKKFKSNSLKLSCLFPTTKHPFYNVKATFDLDHGLEYRIQKIEVNGKPILDYYCYHNDQFQKNRKVKGGGVSELVVRWDWRCGEDISVKIFGKSPDADDSLSLGGKITAPQYGGYWNPSWSHYAGIVCTEPAGLSRINEPVHITLALYSDRISDPVRELRLIAVDPETGGAEEIPSQVYEVSHYHCDEPSERYQPTTTCEVSFFADVPANSSRVYLAFYGNPDAPYPQYESGLRIHGEGLGLTLENLFYRVLLSDKSGSIDEITIKSGTNCTFDHHLETNGAIHWNPGIYAPPRPWLHASDWDPPAQYSATRGTIFTMTSRSGPLDYYPETHVSITYTFYDRVPWIYMSSTMEIKEDIDVKALRNGEIVLNRELVDEFAWSEPDRSIGKMMIRDGPRHPRQAKVLPHDTPWACFFNRKLQCGLGMVTIELANFRNKGGFPRIFQPYSYLQWGPWVYYARPLVYTFISSGPGRLINVPAGNIYYEKMAFVPVKFEEEEKTFTYLDRLYTQLTNPLYVRVVEDTDRRVPDRWMPPILVEEFEEMGDN